MSTKEFYEMTPVEFNYAMEDWNEVHKIVTLEPMKVQYNVMRIMLYHLNNMNPYRIKTYQNYTDVMEFGWDEKKKEQTVDEMKGMLFAIARANKGTINIGKK